MATPKMRDRNGVTVEAINLSGVPTFTVTDKWGALLRPLRGRRFIECTTPDHLAEVGVDLATLKDI
jgi:hypothetical protein